MNPPKTADELIDQMRELVLFIMEHFESPECWPMHDVERVIFVRSVFYRAKRLRESGPFLNAEVMKKTATLAAFMREDSRLREARKFQPASQPAAKKKAKK